MSNMVSKTEILVGMHYYKNNPCVKFWHSFTFCRCYGNKNGEHDKVKIEKLTF